MTVIDKLNAALETARERGKVYGHDGNEVTGRAVAALFKDGITLRTGEDFTRFLFFMMVMTKLGRYVKNFTAGGHQDSIHDIGVYAFLLEDFDDHNNRRQQQFGQNVDGDGPAKRVGRKHPNGNAGRRKSKHRSIHQTDHR